MENENFAVTTLAGVETAEEATVARPPLAEYAEETTLPSAPQPTNTPERTRSPNDEEVSRLVAEIRDMWLHGKERRIELGLKFIRLKELLPHGQYTVTIEETCGIPYTTAHDYVKEALAEGLQQKYEIRSFESPTVGLTNNPEYGKPADDPQAAKVEAAKQEAKSKRQNMPESLNARVDFKAETVAMRDEIKAGTKHLGADKAAVLYHKALHPFRFLLNLIFPGEPYCAQNVDIYQHTKEDTRNDNENH